MKINDLFEGKNLGLTIFDIDETLFRTTAQIKVVKNGKIIKSLTNQEFNNYELQPDEDFDFGEFRDAEKFNRESIPIEPMIAKLKAILRNAGNSKVIMLTARADFDNKDLFLSTFRKYGIDIDKIHVHRAGNLGGSPAENKKVFIKKYLDTGSFARIRLYDDSMTNIKMFISLAEEYPNVKFFPYFVTHEGNIRTIRENNKVKSKNSVVSEWGRIVKGVNTTVDVGPNEIKTQAAKFGNTVDKDGRPPTMSKAVKGKNTNVLFNLGLTEGIRLRLERDKNMDVLHIQDTKEKHRVEVRGKKGYETNGYDPNDKLHQVLDRVGKAANISELMNGEVVDINPNHPQGSRAIRTARDVLQTEDAPRYTAMEWAIIEGGHSLDDLDKPTPTISELVKMHNVPAKVILAQLTKGIEVEYEHTSDFEVAKQIAMDHIAEDPAYYDKLKFIENFADGKVKGKSRPGRVKKSGASCNGSVTSLRKKAKVGGEKGRMYHWCANMKSGRKKS